MKKNIDYEKIEQRVKVKQGIVKTLTYVLLTFWGIVVLFPFFWMVLTSIKSYGEYNSEYIPKFYSSNPTIQNYLDAFTQVPLAQYFLNTLIFTVITTFFRLLCTCRSGMESSVKHRRKSRIIVRGVVYTYIRHNV